MVARVVAGDVLQRVPRQGVAAVIVNRLDRRECEEEYALAHIHACEFEGNAGANGIKEESLEWVVV